VRPQIISSRVLFGNTPQSDRLSEVLHIVHGVLNGQSLDSLVLAQDPMDADKKAVNFQSTNEQWKTEGHWEDSQFIRIESTKPIENGFAVFGLYANEIPVYTTVSSKHALTEEQAKAHSLRDSLHYWRYCFEINRQNPGALSDKQPNQLELDAMLRCTNNVADMARIGGIDPARLQDTQPRPSKESGRLTF